MRDLAGRVDLRNEEAIALAVSLVEEQTTAATLAGADRLTQRLANELRAFNQEAE